MICPCIIPLHLAVLTLGAGLIPHLVNWSEMLQNHVAYVLLLTDAGLGGSNRRGHGPTSSIQDLFQGVGAPLQLQGWEAQGGGVEGED